MQTEVRTPLEIFSMPQHLTVPVFQRRYVWEAEKQWEPLWRDISRVAERRLAGMPTQHFLGAVVTQSTSPGLGSLASHGLIDGQQRLTTLQLLIDAAAAELEASDHGQLAQQLTMLTHNPAAFGLEDALVSVVRGPVARVRHGSPWPGTSLSIGAALESAARE